MPKYDASDLLYRQSENNRFINSLDVSELQIKLMKAARTLTRNKIKTAFTAAKSDKKILAKLDEAQQKLLQGIEPRFCPQGSFIYKTQNLPAKTPPQQIDIDDGAYLPIEAMREAPIINKDIFFGIVDNALIELASDQDWRFIRKDTCARLEISIDFHLDVPLYAIPKERYLELEKAVGRESKISASYIFRESKRYLSEDEVYLARRDKTHWVKSDPMEIYDWFVGSIEVHGEMLRRVCRFLKAWRDHEWLSGGPSSIALMICATTVFDEKGSGFKNDSEALALVFDKLPSMLDEGVVNPRDHEDVVFPRGISKENKNLIVTKAKDAASSINRVLNRGLTPSDVIEVFQRYFGNRISTRSDWVKHIGTSTKAAAATIIVKNTPAKSTSQPEVPNMKAG